MMSDSCMDSEYFQSSKNYITRLASVRKGQKQLLKNAPEAGILFFPKYLRQSTRHLKRKIVLPNNRQE